MLGVEFGEVLEIRNAEHLIADGFLMQAETLNLRADDADQLDAAEDRAVFVCEVGKADSLLGRVCSPVVVRVKDIDLDPAAFLSENEEHDFEELLSVRRIIRSG